jgi:dCMP deaminase
MNWDEYFLNIASMVALKSKDTKKKVGTVLVSLDNNRVLSTGFNGLPANVNDNIDWDNRELVHSLIIHAELNCILYASSRFENAILYSTLSPCKDCVKIIAAANIKKIIFIEKYKDYDIVVNLCKTFNINIHQA